MFTCAAFNWVASPSVTELEVGVLDQLARAFNLPTAFLSTSPNGGGGVIQGSASEAIITTMVAARDRALLKAREVGGEEEADRLRSRLVTICSDQTHSSTQKAAMIVGVKYHIIKSQPGTWRLTKELFQKGVEECIAKNLVPFYATVTIGTTGTCAVDDVNGIAELNNNLGNEIWLVFLFFFYFFFYFFFILFCFVLFFVKIYETLTIVKIAL